jgi:hypothetical protein
VSSAPQQPVAGWYPDGRGALRWWDGRAWTEATAGQPASRSGHQVDPRSGQSYPTVAPGTSATTVWAWIIALAPLVSLAWAAFLLVDLQRGLTGQLSQLLASASPGGSSDAGTGIIRWELSFFTDPVFLIGSLMGWVVVGLSVWFSYLDTQVLRRRGFVSPMHWAWSALSPLVYLIGRSIVIRRRGSSDRAPMWVAIGIQVVAFVGALAWTVVLVTQLMTAVTTAVSIG